jgi:hypothetical protein
MRIAHLILAHNNPQQLEQLIGKLSYADDSIYIHLDKKADIRPFEYLMALKNVHFVKDRVSVKWGACSIVDATINGFKQIMSSGQDHQFVNLLSGADLPLQRAEHIHSFLSANTGKIFMSYMPILDEWEEAVSRIIHYHFNEYAFPGVYKMQALVNKVMPKRKLPNGMIAVGHSQWFTACSESIDFIIKYWDRTPKLRRFIKLTWGPDEFVFQTILYNSRFKDQMVNDNLRYIDWSNGGASPKTFTIADTEALLNSEKLYARKFDLGQHPDVIAEIDKKLMKAARVSDQLESA